jgi:hypothetical protein
LKNIVANLAASGLFPFNLDRVLRSLPKPVAGLAVPYANKVNVEICYWNEVLQTPVTLVPAEGLVSL